MAEQRGASRTNLRQTVPFAVLALALLGLIFTALHLLAPADVVNCYQPPCPQPPKPMAGVALTAAGSVFALVAGMVALGGFLKPGLASGMVAVAGLFLVGVPIPRFWTILQAVRDDSYIVLNERLAALGPLDPLSFVLGLALLACAALLLAGREPAPAVGHPPTASQMSWPIAAGLGITLAAALVCVLPVVGELLVTHPLLQGQYSWSGWMEGSGIPMSGGSVAGGFLLLVLVVGLGLAVWAWRTAARAGRATRAGATRAGLGLAAALVLVGVGLVHAGVLSLQQQLVPLYEGPFVAAATDALRYSSVLMAIAAVLSGLLPTRADRV